MVKMVLGSSDAQGQTMSSVGKARVTAYNSAVTALSNFNGAGDLQGSAYDSGKQYGVSVITPLIKGAIMYSEYLSEAVPKLPSKYRSEVGGEDLDSAVLEREIQSLESSISSLRGTFRAMESSDHADKSLLQNISSRMDSLTSQKNEKMDKLRKLNLFAGSSNEVFSGEGAKSMDTVVKNLASGLNMIQGDFASFGGTFPKHSGKTLNWAKSIEGEWDKKAKIDEDYQKVLEKANQGKELSDDDVKKIEAYQNRYGRELPDTITKAVAQFVFKKTKVAACGNSENDIKKLYKNIQDLDDNDWFKRGAQILGLTPEKLTKAFLQSDGIIGLLDSVDKGTKGRKFVSGVMDAMAWYESLGKRGKTIKYFPKAAKFLGKAGTVMTFADLGITAISSGVNEYSKSKDIGKAAGKGVLSAIGSVGPLEGATIGAAIGGGPFGMAAGFVAGGLIQGIKFIEPKFFDDPVQGTKNIINNVGKGIKGFAGSISKGIGGIGKALGFG